MSEQVRSYRFIVGGRISSFYIPGGPLTSFFPFLDTNYLTKLKLVNGGCGFFFLFCE